VQEYAIFISQHQFRTKKKGVSLYIGVYTVVLRFQSSCGRSGPHPLYWEASAGWIPAALCTGDVPYWRRNWFDRCTRWLRCCGL